jgi:hypothetical protein
MGTFPRKFMNSTLTNIRDALSLFPNMEALIEFLDSRRMMVFKALVLRWSGDIKGAAEVYLQEGRWIEEHVHDTTLTC